MDIFDHARNHHRRAVRLAGQARAARSEVERSQIFSELQDELREHEWLESGVIYPALRDAGGMQGEVGGLLSEHTRLKALSSRVAAAQPQSEEWRQALDELASSLGQHVTAEESQVFPRARQTLDDDVLERLTSAASGEPHGGRSRGHGELSSKMQRKAHETGDWLDEQAKHWSEEAQRRVRSLIEEQGRAAASRGHEVASVLREVGEHLQQERRDSDLPHYIVEAAEGLDRWAGRLEDGEVDRLLEQVRSAARRHPAVLFGGAIGVGFLIARFLKSSGSRGWSTDEHESSAWAQDYERVDPGL